MRSLRKTKRAFKGSDIAPEIYIPLVDSHYQEGRTFLLGYFTATASILLTYWKSGDPLLLFCAFAFSALVVARVMDMRAYARVRDTVKSSESARYWEIRYGLGAASTYVILGFWCFFAFATTNDPYAHLVSLCTTIAYVVGIPGRNFASGRLVIAQILSVAVPLIGGVLVYNDPYYLAFLPQLVLFFIVVAIICDRLRRNLLDAVTSEHEVSLLADRFNKALSNMPNGLCMLDRDRRVVVANGKLNELFGVAASVDLKHWCLPDLIKQCVLKQKLSERTAEEFCRSLEERLAGQRLGKFSVELQDKRTLEFAVEPIENRGMVVLVEDITERKLAEAKINHMAHFDSLTELPNRVILQLRLEEALSHSRRGRACAIHFIDIDQFKHSSPVAPSPPPTRSM